MIIKSKINYNWKDISPFRIKNIKKSDAIHSPFVYKVTKNNFLLKFLPTP